MIFTNQRNLQKWIRFIIFIIAKTGVLANKSKVRIILKNYQKMLFKSEILFTN